MARRALGRATREVVRAVEALPQGPWLVACSGGPDSLALAWAAGFVGRRRGTAVRALVVDHGLQEGSGAVASRVVAALAQLPVPHAEPLVVSATVARVVVADAGAGPEASAREARYAALEAAALPGERVLLGHTLDDQAETVLLGLARGSGTRSLSGMAPSRGAFVRPLLGLARRAAADACAELGLIPWSDPHNADPRFARVRVRTVVLPALERELGPGVAAALARTAVLARADADALDALAAAALADFRAAADTPVDLGEGAAAARVVGHAGSAEGADGGWPESLHCGWLAGLDVGVRDRVLRGWLLARGASEVSAERLAAVASLVTGWRGQRGVDLVGARVVRLGGRLRVESGGAFRG